MCSDVVVGRFTTTVGHTVQVGWAWELFSLIPNSFPNGFKRSNLKKYKTLSSGGPKISKHLMAIDKLKRNNFPFRKKFKFPT
jgi:hypothetical protein